MGLRHQRYGPVVISDNVSLCGSTCVPARTKLTTALGAKPSPVAMSATPDKQLAAEPVWGDRPHPSAGAIDIVKRSEHLADFVGGEGVVDLLPIAARLDQTPGAKLGQMLGQR